MKPQRIYASLLALAFAGTLSFSQAQPASPPPPPAPVAPAGADKEKKEPVVIPDRKITPEGRITLIRGLNAELGFARKPFPFGKTGLTLKAKDGSVTPNDQQLEGMMAGFGPAVKVGDRARITDMKFKDKSIIFDINGGPVKKKKWYEHIQVSGMGGSVSPGQPTDDSNLRGSCVELSFDKFVPDLTPDQVKQLLDPVLNFHAKSASEAYLERIPPVAKAAIKDHRVLVGMDREMVLNAKGKPPQKVREKDGDVDYEEWIYGTPPADVEFVRFVGDEVTQVKTMKVDGTRLVRTEREVTLKKDEPQVAQQAPPPQPGTTDTPQQPPQTASGSDQGPKGRPTLKRPGEDVDQPDGADPRKPRDRVPVGSPDDTPSPMPPN
jgi:hypothetical protein